MEDNIFIADGSKPSDSKQNNLNNNKVFIFHIPSTDIEDIEGYLNNFKLNNPLEKFNDVVCLYLPTNDYRITVERLQ